MIRHAITRGDLPRLPADFLQLRAKDLAASELLRRARWLRQNFGGALLINDRLDIALASGASGVHLPASRLAPARIKKVFDPFWIIGVSCHSIEEVARAAGEGADYVFLSPIFEKPGYAPPLGLDALSVAAKLVSIPVIALGGVTPANEAACLEAGAKGIAGISYFGLSS
jgi:thiamine-phosphate pyrophosphorylase